MINIAQHAFQIGVLNTLVQFLVILHSTTSSSVAIFVHQ